jgi:hypothetical protein
VTNQYVEYASGKIGTSTSTCKEITRTSSESTAGFAAKHYVKAAGGGTKYCTGSCAVSNINVFIAAGITQTSTGTKENVVATQCVESSCILTNGNASRAAGVASTCTISNKDIILCPITGTCITAQSNIIFASDVECACPFTNGNVVSWASCAKASVIAYKHIKTTCGKAGACTFANGRVI